MHTKEHFPQNPDKEPLRETGEVIDQREDPLQDLRTNKEGTPMSKSYTDEEGEIILHEDEVVILEKDPRYNYWVPVEELEEKDSFFDVLDKHKDIADIALEDLADRYHSFKDYADAIENLENPKGFEDQDILGDALRERRADKAKEKRDTKIEKIRTFTVKEFKLMEDCSRFRGATYLAPEPRPMYKAGIPMTDEQIAEQVNAYKEYDANRQKFDQERPQGAYSVDDVLFMEECIKWDFYNQEIQSARPTFEDGSPLTDDQIKELAIEYGQLRREKPEEFAQLKAERGEWGVKEFKWQKKDGAKGPFWQCYKSVPGSLGNITKRYITKEEPVKASGEFYYTVEHKKKIDNLFSIIKVNLKYPTKSPVAQKAEPAK